MSAFWSVLGDTRIVAADYAALAGRPSSVLGGVWVGMLVVLSACSGGGNSQPPALAAPAMPEPINRLPANGSFAAFESGHVRPLAMTTDGNTLLAVNTPDNCLAIIDVSGSGLSLETCVPVGLEPVAVALRNDSEAWVVNHLSDSVSIVQLQGVPHVRHTLYVGDEPRDIVFAGNAGTRTFITTAHRGQNSPVNPQVLTPAVGRADVWVFDANQASTSLGGTALSILTLFADTPRALATSPDGSKVYAAGFLSGNRSTTLRTLVNKPAPADDAAGNPQPATRLIIQFNGRDWVDGFGRTGDGSVVYQDLVDFTLPDADLFEIDANATPPAVTRSISGLGTTLFNLAVNPRSGAIYASNLEANNVTRFEGSGQRATVPTVRGHVVENRITIVKDGQVQPRHLNKHVDYSLPMGTPLEKAASLAMPLQMSISANGRQLYVAAFGSNKIGRFGIEALEDDTFTPSANDHISLSGGGPTGIILREGRNQLIVSTRFDNGIALLDASSGVEVAKLRLFNPEPASIVAGRPFLYDAQISSSRGDSSCASCHIFGDLDALAWDLGNPDQVTVANPNRVVRPLTNPVFHPMKGPMTTQSLRGLKNHGPLHWRGDRTGAKAGAGESLEAAAFKEFNGTFDALFARGARLSDAQMQAFTDFILQLTYPPNPLRNLEGTLTADQAAGKSVFNEDITTGGIVTCNFCHTLDPDRGLFGTSGSSTMEGDDNPQDFKIPQLRNMYQKIGFFNSPNVPQVRGFGFTHDGRIGSLVAFLSGSAFRFANNQQRAQVVQFLLAFDSNLAPAVGQQVTLDTAATLQHMQRLSLLLARAQTAKPDCDLVFQGVLAGISRSGVLGSSGRFQTDRSRETLSVAQLVDSSKANGQEITFTCVPPGNGVRIGIDRNADGVFNGDE